MPHCDVVRTPEGGVAFVCGRGRRGKLCFVRHCGRDSEVLCDWPLGNGKTCDRPCCRGHAKRVGDNVDYCLEHALKERAKA
jgi:hypothetical protein